MNGWLLTGVPWALENAMAASLLAVIVALLRGAGKRWPVRFFYLAGWLVILRAVLPAPVAWRWGWDQPWRRESPGAGELVTLPVNATAFPAGAPDSLPVEADMTISAAKAAAAGVVSAERGLLPGAARSDWAFLAACTWAAGAVVMLGRSVVAQWRLALILKKTAQPAPGQWVDMAKSCARLLSLRRPPQVLILPGGGSPFLTGLRRPVIAVPQRPGDPLSPEEMRHVLLHEMLHIVHRDLAANWLLAIARTLHWWNPLIHLTARRIVADREVLRDRQVLSLLQDAPCAYGHTLLKLALPHFPQLASPPGCAPLFHTEKELKRRITMIASPTRTSWAAATAAAVTLLALSVPFYTTAQEQTEKLAAAAPAQEVPPATKVTIAPVPHADPSAPPTPVSTSPSLTPAPPTEAGKKESRDASRPALDASTPLYRDLLQECNALKASVDAETDEGRKRALKAKLGALEAQAKRAAEASASQYRAVIQQHDALKAAIDAETDERKARDLKAKLEAVIVLGKELEKDFGVPKIRPTTVSPERARQNDLMKRYGQLEAEWRALQRAAQTETDATKRAQLEAKAETLGSTVKQTGREIERAGKEMREAAEKARVEAAKRKTSG